MMQYSAIINKGHYQFLVVSKSELCVPPCSQYKTTSSSELQSILRKAREKVEVS